MGAELKPCPFCGGDAAIRDERYSGTMSSGMETPEPYACCVAGCVRMARERCDETPYGRDHGARTYKKAHAAAVAGWNRRVPEEALRARVAELEEALSDAIQSVESAPERCAGFSMLRTPQIGSRQLAAWKAALTPEPRP